MIYDDNLHYGEKVIVKNTKQIRTIQRYFPLWEVFAVKEDNNRYCYSDIDFIPLPKKPDSLPISCLEPYTKEDLASPQIQPSLTYLKDFIPNHISHLEI